MHVLFCAARVETNISAALTKRFVMVNTHFDLVLSSICAQQQSISSFFPFTWRKTLSLVRTSCWLRFLWTLCGVPCFVHGYNRVPACYYMIELLVQTGKKNIFLSGWRVKVLFVCGFVGVHVFRLFKLGLLVHCKWKSRQTAVLQVCAVQNTSVMWMNPRNKRIALRHCPLTLCCLPGGLPWKCATNTSLSKAQTSQSFWLFRLLMGKRLSHTARRRRWVIGLIRCCALFKLIVKCFTSDFSTLITDWWIRSWLWVFNSCESWRILQLEMSARMLAISFTVIVSIIVQLVFILRLSFLTYSLQKLSARLRCRCSLSVSWWEFEFFNHLQQVIYQVLGLISISVFA